MIAAAVGYDAWFVFHLAVAVTVVVVLGAMRWNAAAVASLDDAQQRERRFPDRVNWAARSVHLAPLSGLALSLLGSTDVSLSRPWVGTGIVLYVVLAGWSEARVLPCERQLALALRSSPAIVGELSRELVRRVDVALVIVTLIYATMIVQF